MQYRLNSEGLLSIIGAWQGFLNKKVHLIACGGTALTLLGVKESTKDVDFIVPKEDEYNYLIKILKDLGYKQASGSGWRRDDNYIFDFFKGKKIHTTELLDSPLNKGKHTLIKEFLHIYLGVLNHYDIIISKLFRGTGVDVEDCLALVRAKKTEIDLEYLKNRFLETSSFDVSQEKANKNLEHFLRLLEKEGLSHEKQ